MKLLQITIMTLSFTMLSFIQASDYSQHLKDGGTTLDLGGADIKKNMGGVQGITHILDRYPKIDFINFSKNNLGSCPAK